MTKTITMRDMQRDNVTGAFWVAVIKKDHSLEDILKSEYWAHVADSTFMGMYNEITAVWEDGDQLAKLYVKDYSSTAALVEVIFYKDYREKEGNSLPREERYVISWGSPQRKHVITDSVTGNVVKEGLKSKTDAQEFVVELERQERR